MIKTVIIDDEPSSIETLSLLLEKHKNEIEICGKAHSVNEGVEVIQHIRPQLIFLDVEMPGKNGFELLKAFEDPDFKVIFITGYSEYAISAVRYSALDFLLKPLNREELDDAIHRAKKEIDKKDDRLRELKELYEQQKPRFLVIPENNGYKRIEFKNILYIEAQQGGYSTFHFENGKSSLAVKPLSYYEKLLPEELFFRAHRSHLVHLEKIVSWELGQRNKVVLTNGVELDVSVRRKAKLKKILHDNAE